ncbi:MAG: Ig-like domain-containing protein [Luteolibacter sp.]
MKTSRLALVVNLGGASQSSRFAPSESSVRNILPGEISSICSRIVRLSVLAACFFANAYAAIAPTLNLQWDVNPETGIQSYELSYGLSSKSYTTQVNVGKNTTAAVTGLVEGKTYFFVVSAYNQAGLKSPESSEISYLVPLTKSDLVPQAGWTLLRVDSQETAGYPATAAFDGDPNTFWHTQWTGGSTPPPHDLQINLGTVGNLNGFRYLPRQDNYSVGNIGQYEFYVSMDGVTWGSPVASGTFANTAAEKEVLFTPKNGKFIRLRSLTEINGGTHSSVAELSVLQQPGGIINQAPTATAAAFTTAQDMPITATLAGSDANGDTVSFSIVSSPSHGSLSGTAPNLTYTPALGFSGTDQFTFRANDGTADSAVAAITVTVTPLVKVIGNLPPVFDSNTIVASATEDLPFSGQLSAKDGNPDDVLTYSKISGPEWLSVSTTGALSGTPANGNIGVNVFSVRVTDTANEFATAVLSIAVANTNDAPVFKMNPMVFPSGSESVAYTGQTLAGAATDPDPGDTITYSKTSGPAWLGISSSGAIGGTPPLGSKGLHEFTIRATDAAGIYGEATLQIRIIEISLPLPWSLDRIGNGNLTGGASYSSGNFTLMGSGELARTEDAGTFAWQTLTGDGNITARVQQWDRTSTSFLAGVMIRESLAANSRQVFIGVTGDANYRWLRRVRTASTISSTLIRNSNSTNLWLRLVRSRNTFIAYRSINGTSWTKIGSSTVTLPKNCYIGLSVSSGANITLGNSMFSNVSVTP